MHMSLWALKRIASSTTGPAIPDDLRYEIYHEHIQRVENSGEVRGVWEKMKHCWVTEREALNMKP